MNSKFFGGILLILGTSIGAGLLALPVTCAQTNFVTAFFLLVGCWAIMTFGAFLLLEVNLMLPKNSNLISMAKFTLGTPGLIITWLVYLFLLYSLLSAYISGTSDIMQSVLSLFHITNMPSLNTLLAVGILGTVVYRGIYSVDLVNRGLMITKIIVYALIIMAIAPHIHPEHLFVAKNHILIATIMVINTSYGFAIIIPSLRIYFNSDVKKLRLAILIGSLIPLALYILWVAVVQGLLPLTGSHSLSHMLSEGHTTTELAAGISAEAHKMWIATLAHVFTYICALTSFLGVSLALTDFLADGLKLRKKGKQGIVVFSVAFIPPLLIVLFKPGIFITALSYAGILCVILLMLLPALMTWSGRYRHKAQTQYRVFGGKVTLAIEMLIAIVLTIWGIANFLLS